MKQTTLCFLFRSGSRSEVLLGLKKARFGAGNYTGFGGKVEAGETILNAAVREVREETGVEIRPEDLRQVGTLTFHFPAKPNWSQAVQVFIAEQWTGEPLESEEMRPAWFSVERIPYDRMWADAPYWLPLVLAGERFAAEFVFEADNQTLAAHSVITA